MQLNKNATLFVDPFNYEFTTKPLFMNMEMAMVLFESIMDYPFLHSSPYLVDSITVAISEDLPRIGDYLDKRIKPYKAKLISTM